MVPPTVKASPLLPRRERHYNEKVAEVTLGIAPAKAQRREVRNDVIGTEGRDHS
jgi:hypothetical protein